MAAFGLSRAVRGAVAMQQGFRTLAGEQRAAVGAIGLRVAVNSTTSAASRPGAGAPTRQSG